MILSTLARRAITAALVAAASAAGSYAMRRYADRRKRVHARRQNRIEESRWEGEGGSPTDATAAVPHHPNTMS